MAHIQIDFTGAEPNEEFPVNTRESPDLPPEIQGQAV